MRLYTLIKANYSGRKTLPQFLKHQEAVANMHFSVFGDLLYGIIKQLNCSLAEINVL